MNGATGKGSGVIAEERRRRGRADAGSRTARSSPTAAGRARPERTAQIWMVDIAKGATSAHQMTAGPDDRRPAFSPNGKVIAFIRRTPTTHRRHRRRSLLRPHRRSTLHQGVVHQGPEVQRRPADVVARRSRDPRRRRRPEGREPDRARRVHDREAVLVEPARLGLAGARHRQDARDEAGRGRSSTPRSRPTARRSRSSRTGARRTRRSSGSSPRAGRTGSSGRRRPSRPSIRACEVAWRSDSGELVGDRRPTTARRARARSCG